MYIPGIYKQRNKTFFFFNYEGHRENDPLTATVSTVPIPAFRNGDFSALLGAQIGTDAFVQTDSGRADSTTRSRTRQVTATCGGPDAVRATIW